jgi:hypothetical protein
MLTAPTTAPAGTDDHASAEAPVPPALAHLRAVPLVDQQADELAGHHPTLESSPVLHEVLAVTRASDRLVARLVELLDEVVTHDLAEVQTGLALESWLAIAAGQTRADRRMLLTCVDVLRRLPTLRQAFLTDATVSWAQTRTIVLRVRELPHHLDDAIDDALARALAAASDAHPDDLLHVVTQVLDRLDAERRRTPEPRQAAPSFLAMQPRLDGSGGKLFGELDQLDFATVDAALNLTDGSAPARQVGPSADEATGGRRDGGGPPSGNPGGLAAQRRAARLVALCDRVLTPGEGTPGNDIPGDDTPGNDTAGANRARPAGSRPQLLLRAELDALLDRSRTPATLLTTLLGGHVTVDAATARRLVVERGADLRTVVINDTGAVVGVGRRHRVAPGWLKDTTLAVHDTCSHPGCLRAARTAQTDHATPWWPHRPDDDLGRTDIDQLAPTCTRHNLTKEADGWLVQQRPSGTRRWVHPASGVQCDSLPATWRPPPVDPPVPERHRTPAQPRGPDG